jgi:glutaredoxin 2
MLGSTTIQQEASALSALIQVLADPVKTKAQLEELKKAAQTAVDAEQKLVEERVELQSVRSLTEQLINDSDGLVREADDIVKRAAKMVDDSIRQKNENSALAISVVAEARDLVVKMQLATQQGAEAFQDYSTQQEAKAAALDNEIAKKEARLADINAQLEKLRGTIGA